jgi:hypothetical protein
MRKEPDDKYLAFKDKLTDGGYDGVAGARRAISKFTGIDNDARRAMHALVDEYMLVLPAAAAPLPLSNRTAKERSVPVPSCIRSWILEYKSITGSSFEALASDLRISECSIYRYTAANARIHPNTLNKLQTRIDEIQRSAGAFNEEAPKKTEPIRLSVETTAVKVNDITSEELELARIILSIRKQQRQETTAHNGHAVHVLS